MKLRFCMLSIFAGLILWASTLWAQDLGPGFTKVKDGIYVYAAKDGNSTCSIVLTEEGPVIIDTCQSPVDGQKLLATVKKSHGQAHPFRHRYRGAQRSHIRSFHLFAAGHRYQSSGGNRRDEQEH